MKKPEPVYMEVRAAGFVVPHEKLRFEINARKYRCGEVRDGVGVYLDDEAGGGVLDFDELCRAVDAIRKVRALAVKP
jgi:hypothetical protein